MTATFFVLGLQVAQESLTPTLQRAVAEGHSVASHSYSHLDMSTSSLADIRADMITADDIIHAATCLRPRLMRPPYGAINAESQLLLESMGYRIGN